MTILAIGLLLAAAAIRTRLVRLILARVFLGASRRLAGMVLRASRRLADVGERFLASVERERDQ